MYVDAAYCYRQSSVVCQNTDPTPAKMAVLIEMPFESRTVVGPSNCIR